MSDFQDVIREKIQELAERRVKVANLLGNSGFHVSKMREAMNDVKAQVEEYEGTFDDLKSEFLSVCNQVPDIVAGTWSDGSSALEFIDAESRRWSEMLQLYQDWEDENKKIAERDAELSAAIESEELEEPSRMTGIRRKPGTKPEIGLGKHRRLSKKLESGEDSEA